MNRRRAYSARHPFRGPGTAGPGRTPRPLLLGHPRSDSNRRPGYGSHAPPTVRYL